MKNHMIVCDYLLIEDANVDIGVNSFWYQIVISMIVNGWNQEMKYFHIHL
jgi:hypothetical protein